MAKYEIALFANPKHQVTFRKPRNAWGIRYKARKKGETMFKNEWKQIDAVDRFDAIKQCEEFYLRALTAGAVWIDISGKRPLRERFKSRPMRQVEDRDMYIRPYEVKSIRYKVYIDKKTLKAGFKSIEDARKYRDDYLRGGAKLRYCKLCNQPPVWIGLGDRGTATLVHKQPGCPNRVHIGNRDLDAVAKILVWNDHFADGSKPGWGRVTAQDIFKLGVFTKMVHTRREVSGKAYTQAGRRKVKEEEVFADITGISDDEV